MRYLIIVLLAWPFAAAAGQTIYRSVDDSGAVTYSSKPVQGAAESRPLILPPGPTEEQKAAARARLEQTQQMSRDIAAQREARQAKPQSEQEEELALLGRSGSTVGAQPTREEVAADARRKAEERKEESVDSTNESAREALARRREDRPALPREPVHIQPVPSIGRPGDGAPGGARGGRRGRAGG